MKCRLRHWILQHCRDQLKIHLDGLDMSVDFYLTAACACKFEWKYMYSLAHYGMGGWRDLDHTTFNRNWMKLQLRFCLHCI